MVAEDVNRALREMVEEREWGQFHTPANLAKSIAIEAAELLQCYQWDDSSRHEGVTDELADVLTYCHLLAHRLNVDADQIVLDKLEATKRKYPIEKARGRSTRYDQLPD